GGSRGGTAERKLAPMGATLVVAPFVTCGNRAITRVAPIGSNIRGAAALLLPLPACGERVGGRGRIHRGGLSEGKGPVRQAQTRREAPSPGAQERADLSPQAGRGKDGAALALMLAPMRVAPTLGIQPTHQRRNHTD